MNSPVKKTVYEEVYKDHLIRIDAQYTEDHEILFQGEWKKGQVYLYADIIDSNKRVVGRFTNDQMLTKQDTSKYDITFQRKTKRYGFLNLKKEIYLVHIAAVYTDIFPRFLRLCKNDIDALLRCENRQDTLDEITEGMPDSLLDL